MNLRSTVALHDGAFTSLSLLVTTLGDDYLETGSHVCFGTLPLGAVRATSNTGELSAIYRALDWIYGTGEISPRCKLFSDNDSCVKLFATRSIQPVANKRIIARIHALLDQVKHDNSIFISRNPVHSNANNPLAKHNAEADRLVGGHREGCPSPWTRARSSPPTLERLENTAPRAPRPPNRTVYSLCRSGDVLPLGCILSCLLLTAVNRRLGLRFLFVSPCVSVLSLCLPRLQMGSSRGLIPLHRVRSLGSLYTATKLAFRFMGEFFSLCIGPIDFLCDYPSYRVNNQLFEFHQITF